MAHVRNIYKDDVDFSALALQDPEFNRFVKVNGQLDFSNPQAVKQLTISLLKRDFGLKLELPDDRLCPPVPNRLNYILWIQDLLDTTSESYSDGYDAKREIVGLDIGTGASCIYPLLGCAQRPNWKFVATDVDEKSLQYARKNVLANELKARIMPLPTKPDGPLIPLDAVKIESIDFTMCNPPFYPSSASMLESAAAKCRPPNSACTGAEVEMVTQGGEVAFVTRMVNESLKLKERVQWCSSMLGKLSSVSSVIEVLKEKGCSNWAVREFVQGQRTRRWGVAWSWNDLRPSMSIARGVPSLSKHLLPFPSEFHFTPHDALIDEIAARVNKTMQSLDLRWIYRSQISTGIALTKGNVWSRSARRKKEKNAPTASSKGSGGHEKSKEKNSDESEEEDVQLGVKILIRRAGSVQAQTPSRQTEVTVRWLRGVDSVLFESFCGMLKRQTEKAV